MTPKEYSKKKIAITLDEKLLNKIDKIRSYPRWKGNRSNLIEECVGEFLNSEEDISKEAKCIFCGCTDSKPCKGGCYWIIVDHKKGIGVCSQCALKVMQNPKKLKEVIENAKKTA